MSIVSQSITSVASSRKVFRVTENHCCQVGGSRGKMGYYLICLWSLLVLGQCIPDDELYTLHLNPVNFDKASKDCQSSGFLTKVASSEEASNILNAISNMSLTKDSFEFWVGLRKRKQDCVKQNEPLKGFKWTVDGSSDTELNKWKTLPEGTCTGILCVYLSGKFNGTNIVDWGFVSSTCKGTRPFICKKAVFKHCTLPVIPEAQSIKRDPTNNHSAMLECRSGKIFELTCSTKTLKWEYSNGSAIDGICAREATTAPPEGNDAHLMPVYKPTTSPTIRIILTSLPDQTTDILPMDEVNIVDSGSNIFIPVLIAVMVLVIVVVVVLAIVKFCLRKQSKQLAMKKAENVSMNRMDDSQRDSLENANEKESI